MQPRAMNEGPNLGNNPGNNNGGQPPAPPRRNFSMLIGLFVGFIIFGIMMEVLEEMTESYHNGNSQGKSSSQSSGASGRAQSVSSATQRRDQIKQFWSYIETGEHQLLTSFLRANPNFDSNARKLTAPEVHPLFFVCDRNEGQQPSQPGKKGEIRPLLMARALLSHPKLDPNGDGSSWSPLKVALARGNKHVVMELVQHNKIIREVSYHGLACDVVSRTPNSVAFIVDQGAPECFLEHGRIVQERESKFVARSKVQAASAAEIRTIETGGSGARGIGKNTAAEDLFGDARSAPAPARGAFVIHPGYFNSLYSAMVFYVTGTSLSTGVWVLLLTLSVLQGGLVLSAVGPTLAEAKAGNDERPPVDDAGNPANPNDGNNNEAAAAAAGADAAPPQ